MVRMSIAEPFSCVFVRDGAPALRDAGARATKRALRARSTDSMRGRVRDLLRGGVKPGARWVVVASVRGAEVACAQPTSCGAGTVRPTTIVRNRACCPLTRALRKCNGTITPPRLVAYGLLRNSARKSPKYACLVMCGILRVTNAF